jgi:hypothetical protein
VCYHFVGVVGFFVALQDLFTECQSQVGFFIVWIQLYTVFGVLDCQAVVLEFGMDEGPVGIINCNFGIWNDSSS